VESGHPLAEVRIVLALLVPSPADVIGDREHVRSGVPAEPADQAKVSLMGMEDLRVFAQDRLIVFGKGRYPPAVPQAYDLFRPFPAAHRQGDTPGEHTHPAGRAIVTVTRDQRPVHCGPARGRLKVGDGVAQYLRWDASNNGQALGGHGRAAAPVRGDVTAERRSVQPVGVSESRHVGGAGFARERPDLPGQGSEDGGRDPGHDQAAPSRLD
jgi:hypothetical protein